jgi:hypothetical protein
MQGHYAADFTREQGSTEADWLRWLPGAVRDQALALPGPGLARVAIGAGELQLDWHALPPRQIALARFPRLIVHFRFVEVGDEARHAFMKYFDLYMQRGGG